MNSQARDYDPENRPRFNEWVRVDAAGNKERRITDGGDVQGTVLSKKYTISSAVPVFLFFLATSTVGAFMVGRDMGYRTGLTAVPIAAPVVVNVQQTSDYVDLIQSALKQCNALRKSDIKVQVIDTKVILKGRVVDKTLINLAQFVAEGVMTGAGIKGIVEVDVSQLDAKAKPSGSGNKVDKRNHGNS